MPAMQTTENADRIKVFMENLPPLRSQFLVEIPALLLSNDMANSIESSSQKAQTISER
jgi:hypothetical protein